MKKQVLFLLLLAPLNLFAQTFWTEDFGSGCSSGNLASGFTGNNGTWNVTSTGVNDNYANQWYVSATEAGMGIGNCGDGCGNTPSLTNRTLHLGAAAGLIGDQGASYNAGGLCFGGICVKTDKRAESPVINCAGKSNITLTFAYLQEGSPGSDYASLFYYDGAAWYCYNGSTWTATNTGLPITLNSSCVGQGLWTAYSVALPASANNNPNVKIGFRWVNNDDGVGTDPSFAVDDVRLSSTAAAICNVNASVTQQLLCHNDCNGVITAIAAGQAPFTYWWDTNSGTSQNSLSGLCAGSHSVFITDGAGCTSPSVTVMVAQPALLQASASAGSIIACHGDCTGSLICNASGGTGNLSYLWSNGSIASQINSICAGTYTVTITDANNCQLSFYTTFTEPALLEYAADTLNAATCGTCNDGSICAGIVNGGVGPYAYSSTPASTFNNGCFEFLSNGIYNLCVTDANGCSVCHTDTLGTISGLSELHGSPFNLIAYPNPVKSGSHLQFNTQLKSAKVMLKDLKGSVVLSIQSTTKSSLLIPKDLSPGIYFLEVTFKDASANTKLVVEK